MNEKTHNGHNSGVEARLLFWILKDGWDLYVTLQSISLKPFGSVN